MNHADEEYRALRRTIALRGTVRMALLPFTVAAWSLLAWAVLVFAEIPWATVFPLAVLIAGFESVHALHVGVERIGRYVQVYYETEAEGPKWETTAMAVGPALPGGGTDPLFSAVFIVTVLGNLVPLLTMRTSPTERLVLGALHAAVIARVVRARGAAARQRAVELESYRAIKAGGSKA
jgi:hypothetical protein